MSRLKKEREQIRAAGLRATPSRAAVLELLRSSTSPLTHAEVAEQLDDSMWDKATLYRNLNDLSEAGLLRRISLSEGYRFEHTEGHLDATPVHFVCRDCEQVQCLPHWTVKAPRSSPVPGPLGNGDIEIQILGRCDSCCV